MNYLIIFGSNMFYGTNGVLTVQVHDRFVEFFRVREIYRVRSEGSYLAVDCDIKDNDNVREVKLFKSLPVTKSDKVITTYDKRETIAKRQDGSIIIKIEQLELNNIPLIDFGPIKKFLSVFQSPIVKEFTQQLNSITIDAVLKFTGDFYAGHYHIISGEDYLIIQGNKFESNLSIGPGGIKLTNSGFSM